MTSPAPRLWSPRQASLAGIASMAVTLMVASGCSSIPALGTLPLSQEAKAETNEATESNGTVSVQMQSRIRRTTTVDVPLSENTRVQDVLDASRATSKFRHMEVMILRPTPNASEPVLKLECRFDGKTRRIGWESDYAVLPGDRVLVREAVPEGLNKALGGFLGPVLGGR